MNRVNNPQSYAVPTTPHIRIHKDHPIEHVISDVQSSVQTRRMKTSYSEQGFLSAIYEGKTYQDLHTCLFFACFPLTNKTKKSSKALSESSIVGIQKQKDERGIVIRNKARLVAQGHTQEEGIDYDEVFAPMARIEAIRIFLAYASYMGFMVYQIDVKSPFLYGQIKRGSMYSASKILEKPLVQDGDAADVDEHLYRSMIGSLMYLTASRPDIMFVVCACVEVQWTMLELTHDRKSTTGAEYVAAASCCGQVLWIQNQLLDYGYNFMNTVIYIDNNSTICIIENPVQHSKTKHIEIRHHFIRDCNAKKLIQMAKIDTEHNVADLLTKGFDAGRFQYLVSSIGMLNP
ncbi:putative ribonuclease H-like domain-containing protein [Tanacetum coccineum]